MKGQLDLEDIKTRLYAASPGPWAWCDDFGPIPYHEAYQQPDGKPRVLGGNDGSLGVTELYRRIDEGDGEDTEVPLLTVNSSPPTNPNDPERPDYRSWRGPIRALPADLHFIAHAPTDIEALITEVERLRALVPPEGAAREKRARPKRAKSVKPCSSRAPMRAVRGTMTPSTRLTRPCTAI